MNDKTMVSIDPLGPRLFAALGITAIFMILIGSIGFPIFGLVLPSLVFGWLHKSASRAILRIALLAGFVWVVASLVQDASVGYRISERVSAVFLGSPDRTWFGVLAYALTALSSALIAGSAGWCGNSVRRVTNA